MKRIRMILGVVLILSAIAGLVYWEAAGREMVLTEPVLVAKETILKGAIVDASDFASLGILEESRIKGALSPERLKDIIGKESKQLIPKNAQLAEAFFQTDEFCLKEGESIFVIKPEWIRMRSSSLRRGDFVEIYEVGSMTSMGVYRVAFVKDSQEIEVKDPSTASVASPLERTDATAAISHIEIITDIASYQRIVSFAETGAGGGLILLQNGGKID